MENKEHIVEFDKYCKTCKHYKKYENDEPCDECLEVTVRMNSHKPEKWEGKNGDTIKRGSTKSN